MRRWSISTASAILGLLVAGMLLVAHYVWLPRATFDDPAWRDRATPDDLRRAAETVLDVTPRHHVAIVTLMQNGTMESVPALIRALRGWAATPPGEEPAPDDKRLVLRALQRITEADPGLNWSEWHTWARRSVHNGAGR